MFSTKITDSKMKIDYIIQTPSKIFLKPKSFQFTCRESFQLVIRTGKILMEYDVMGLEVSAEVGSGWR